MNHKTSKMLMQLWGKITFCLTKFNSQAECITLHYTTLQYIQSYITLFYFELHNITEYIKLEFCLR